MSTVIDLVNSDDDESVPIPPRKKLKQSQNPPTTSPFCLLTTDADLSTTYDEKAHKSLRDLLGVEDHQIEWIVIGNYMIDFGFLVSAVPELRTVQHGAVFYGYAETSFASWKRTCEGIDFVQLDPSQPTESPSNPTAHRIFYGVHHSKYFLVGYSDQTMRVAIHTANLRHGDIHNKCQGTFLQDFALKDSSAQTMSPFESDLASYLASYRHTKKCFPSPNGFGFETLLQRIRRYDFATAKVVIVASTPGYHPLDVSSCQKRGHLKLRDAINKYVDSSVAESDSNIILQFSSIGSLSDKYLRQLQASMRGLHRDETTPIRLKLVYPTVQEIRNSIEGYVGGASVPGTAKNVQKPFLRRIFHKWTCAGRSNPHSKERHVPHIKTYFKLNCDGNGMDWFVEGSHNLSKAAWGEVQMASRNGGGRRLFVRHWELSVFTCPSLLGSDRLSPDELIPLPYALRPEKYSEEDEPWAVDQQYQEADVFGRHSVQG